jgi:hypothetical protein
MSKNQSVNDVNAISKGLQNYYKSNFNNPKRSCWCFLKQYILQNSVDKQEFERMRDCCYEFSIQNMKITKLETWLNPEGSHDFKEIYKQEFIVDIPIESILSVPFE